MNDKTFLILGGYGGAGFPITRLLLQETDVRIVLAGRNREKAERAAGQLNTEFPNAHLTWRYADADYARKVDFGPDFGVRVCYPVWFEEMRALPEQYGLEEAGAYIAGFSSLDDLMLRLVELLNKLKRETGTRFLAWLLWKLSPMARPPFGVRFKLEAAGTRDGKARSLEMLAQHDDPHVLTAICTVGCLLQYLDGSIRQPGLWLMGRLVEPDRLLKEMERMGAKVSIEV